jgi:hypothetical protein
MKDAMQKTFGGVQKRLKEHLFFERTGFNPAHRPVQESRWGVVATKDRK